MTNERSYPKKPGAGKPAPVGGEIPTVNVAAEVAARKQAAEQAVSQADSAGPRVMWTMPKPQSAPPPRPEPEPQPQPEPQPETSQPSAEDVEQTQRLPFGSSSQPTPVQPAQPVQPVQPVQAKAQTAQPPAESVEQTQRLPFPAGSQSAPVRPVPDEPQQSVDQTQRLVVSAAESKRPVPEAESPEQTQAYVMEDTASSLPQAKPKRQAKQAQAQPQPYVQSQLQQQQQPLAQAQPPQPQAQAQPGAFAAPTPTLRFDEIQAVGDDQPLNPGEYRHFGPGVPAQPGAQSRAATVWRGESPPAPQGRPKRRRAFAGWLLALAVFGIVLGILAWFYYFGAPVKVTGATVKGPGSTVACGQTATITGTLQTNGDTGTVTYQWKRSDGTQSNVLTQHFNKGTHQASVVLLWTFNGQGSLKATATLDVISPDPTSSAATFDYACNH
jgi:hypothetical protein